MTELLGQIVNLKDETFPQITIIGPQRSGKSTSVCQIANKLNERIGKDYTQYRAYDSHFWSWWEEAEFDSTQIFFFDNTYPIWSHLTRQSYEDLVNRSSFDQILVVTVLNSIEYQSLRLTNETSRIKVFNKEPFEFYFKRPTILEIENIIKKRTESLGRPVLFPPEVLKAIGGLSLGLPGLALWLVRNLISTLENQEKRQNFTPTLVHKIAQYLGFGPALKLILEHDLHSHHQVEHEITNKVWPALQSLQDSSNVDSSPLMQTFSQSKRRLKSWKPLLEEIILLSQQSNTIRRSELQERTGIKESSLTYQCNNLVKEKIVTYSKRGREVFYQLKTPVKEALELTLFAN
ncbi:MAG: helix-turn-helix domain-containing protein [Candidatus Hodarchaeales archaeon]